MNLTAPIGIWRVMGQFLPRPAEIGRSPAATRSRNAICLCIWPLNPFRNLRDGPSAMPRGYEHSDVRAKWIGGVVAFLVIGCNRHYTSFWVFNYEYWGRAPQTQDAWSTADPRYRPEDPHQRTQGFKFLRLPTWRAFRAREDADLNTVRVVE